MHILISVLLIIATQVVLAAFSELVAIACSKDYRRQYQLPASLCSLTVVAAENGCNIIVEHLIPCKMFSFEFVELLSINLLLLEDY